MRKFRNVEYTNPFELLFLFVSTIAVFSGILYILNKIMSFGLVKGIIAIIIAGVYFFIYKKNYIVKVSDFELSSNKLKWKNKNIDFNNIEYYKIHWLKGAGIKFKLKNGKTLRISSNDNFCDSGKFVNLCHKIDSKLLSFNKGQIVKRKSFGETKIGYYFAITITCLAILAIVFKLLTKGELKIGGLGLILFSLATMWSGIKWKRK